MHTCIKDKPHCNTRAGEQNIILDPSGYRAFAPDYLILENELDTDIKIEPLRFRSHPDPWNTNYETFDNHIHALWSLKQVTTSVKPDSDVVIFCRPDVLYLNPLQPEWFTDARLCRLRNYLIFINFRSTTD